MAHRGPLNGKETKDRVVVERGLNERGEHRVFSVSTEPNPDLILNPSDEQLTELQCMITSAEEFGQSVMRGLAIEALNALYLDDAEPKT